MNYLGLGFCIISLALFLWIYKKHREYLSLFVLAVVMVLPKVNIISLSKGTAAGLRTDDLIMLVFMVVVLLERFKTCKVVFKSKVFWVYAAYILSSIISFVIGFITHQTFMKGLSFFSLMRKIEYFCFVFLGYDFMFFNKDNYQELFNKFIYAFTTFTAVLSVLQYFDVIGTYRGSEYAFWGVGMGTFNGPYEIGGLFAILFAYFILNIIKKKDIKINGWYAVVAFLIILLSKSRSSLVIALVLVFGMCFVYARKKWKIIITGCGTVCIALFLLVIKLQCFPVLDRFYTLNFNDGVDAVNYYIENVEYKDYRYILENNLDVEDFDYTVGDESFNTRMYKWVAVLKTVPNNWLFGYGFGSNSTLDGNYVKLLVENGVVGTTLFIMALLSVLRCRKNNNLSRFMVWFLIVQLAGATFIDLFEASKIMECLWFLIGISFHKIEEPHYSSLDYANVRRSFELLYKQKTKTIKKQKGENL